MSINNFQPCVFLSNGHLQTWAAAFLPRAIQATKMETIALADNDIMELHWLLSPQNDAPILFLLHGLEGSVRSPYIQGMLQVAHQHQWHAVVPHLRGSKGRINKISQSYHAGRTDDVLAALQHVRSHYPHTTCIAAGYSLGANLLLKFLGENPEQRFIKAAVAVCAPFDLAATAAHMRQGINKIYEQNFIESLKQTIAFKMTLNMPMPIDLKELINIKTMYEFDDKVTAPLHHFLNAEEYYEQCSAQRFLSSIQTPTLLISAEDDPIIPKSVIPKASTLNTYLTLDLQHYGGHVGFISCKNLTQLDYWLERRIPQYLASQL